MVRFGTGGRYGPASKAPPLGALEERRRTATPPASVRRLETSRRGPFGGEVASLRGNQSAGLPNQRERWSSRSR